MKPAPGFFLTGTDTGVGKTRVACALVRELRSRGVDGVGLKPIACGDRDDAVALYEAAERSVSLEVINPLWLATPAAPSVAAATEGRTIDLEALYAHLRQVRRQHACVLVEGVGGWRVPITRDCDLGDFAAALELPVLVVVANRLGAINHTRLTLEAILARGLRCAGIILNSPRPVGYEDEFVAASNGQVLEELLPVPVLGSLAYGAAAVQWKPEALSLWQTL